MPNKLFCLLSPLLALGLTFSHAALAANPPSPFKPETVSADAYDRASKRLSEHVKGSVKNLRVVPNWIGEADEFWYQRDTTAGTEYVIIDAASGKRRPAFDHQKLAAALSAVTQKNVTAEHLGIGQMKFTADRNSVELRTASAMARCDLKAYRCTALGAWTLDPMQLVAPDGAKAAFARSNNLWLRDQADGKERALTDDGEAHYGWGIFPGGFPGKLYFLRAGIDGVLMGVKWSPDGRLLVAPRVDERKVADYPFYEAVRANGGNRPRVLNKRIPLYGDAEVPLFEMFVFDMASGKRQLIALPKPCEGSYNGSPPEIIWSGDSSKAYFVCIAPDSSRWELVQYDVKTATTRSTFNESADTWLDLNTQMYGSMGSNLRILEGKNQAVVFSQRDGWGHLYRIDLSNGKVINPITQGEWAVQDLVTVDEDNAWVYYTAGGREPGRNPYWRHVYRTSLDGDTTELLTSEAADHAITASSFIGAVPTISPSQRYFVDNQSTIDTTPVSLLRRSDGSIVTTLETADATGLFARGYQPPEAFKVKAADGTTDVYGVIYRPKNLQAGMKYPLIEQIYGGPQTTVTPRDFASAADLARNGGQGNLANMTELGFAVVVMDVRGTPWRSKKFHDYTWKNHHGFAIEDHVAAIKQLGERFDWLDLDRVGVTGHSWGGYSSALAMLRFPEFYTVGVSSAPLYDYGFSYPAFLKWVGWPEYADGGRIAPDDSARPINLVPHSAMADQLKGKLFIVYGDHDENVLPGTTMTFVDALIKADKDFDFLVMPNHDHNYSNDPYFIRRRWDYFVEHLLGAEPPKNYHIPVEQPGGAH